MAARAEFTNDPLRLAKRIGADQHTSAGIRMYALKEPIDLASGFRVSKDWQAEGCFSDEDVTRNWHKAFAGRVRASLIIAGHDHSLTIIVEHDLRGTEDVSCGHKAHIQIANTDAFSIAYGLPAGLHSIA